MRHSLGLLLLVLLIGPTALAAERPFIPHTDETIVVDGRLDEAVWSKAAEFELPYETRPGENTPAPLHTQAWLIHSDTHLYVAFRAHDPDPSRIRAYFRERDDIFGDDLVSITLDPYGGQRRGYQLFVNPLGVQADLFINELAGTEDSSYGFIWDSAGRITDDGYEVEIAIPFSSLRFPASDKAMTWGLDLVRFYNREHSRRFALSPLERGNDCYLCQVRPVDGFAGTRSGSRLELTPELSLGERRFPAETGDGQVREQDSNLGVTAQWALTPSLTLTGTVNPDFSQVAVDPLELDINQPFGIQRQERRPFFQESADVFQTPMESVQTRNLIEPSAGLKLAGQLGAQAVGLFHVRDRQLNLIRPGPESAEFLRLDQESESTAFRLRRDVLRDSGVGLLLTRRTAEDYENNVVSLDGQFRPSRRDTLRYQWARSETRDGLGEDNGPEPEEGQARYLNYQHERRNVYAGLSHDHRDAEFRADLGFMPQTGIEENSAWAGTRWFGDGSGFLTEADLRVQHRRRDSLVDDQRLLRDDELQLALQGQRQSRLTVASSRFEQWQGGQRFDGERWFTRVQYEPIRGLRLEAEADGGDQIDFVGLRAGESRRFAPRLRADIGRHLELDLRYQREILDVDEGRLFTASTRELRAGWYPGLRTSLRLISQWADIERDASLYPDGMGEDEVIWANQLTFTWRLDPRTEFIAGYSDRRSGASREALSRDAQRIFVKMSYAWQI
ncbi:carbohydrate binding family 9 domain-containing protein [Natronospira bacteriovora]|uniref:DUF5916 domain-containing protein n=1 Tax=Natronospira bacteriovora TaxID=3069753 RepID=A0ABU0WA02_9GAMM|nr:carbohydrate binding family 9 domain-containing protein [Natronospira sp. AB-CW4]MDQ2070821.1 DUF5916 domain-containing protein [Natronospira sp. AB-CW4]